MPPQKKKIGNGITAAAASAPAGRRMSKKLLDAIAERKAAGFSDDDVYDDDEDSDTVASADAADAAAAPPIEPYVGANGEATSRATSLPPLPRFETFRANSATAPPLLLLAGQSTANSATAPNLLSSAVQSTARISGRSGSVLSFITTTPSIRQTTNTATTPSSIRDNDLLTPSSITTEGGEEGGGGEAIDLCGEEGEEVCLPAISAVWECAYINCKDVNGKEGWECQWCGLSFKPRHATRAMRHVLKLKGGGDIAICKAVISAKYRDQYQALYDRQFARIESKRKSDKRISDSVTEQQEAAVKSFLETRKQPFFSSHVVSASGGAARSSSSPSLQGQRSVSTMLQSDIRRSNNAMVEITIADFFHCKNIPDAVVESPRFKRLISVCRLRLTEFHRDAIAEVLVRRLHLTPCPNTHPEIARMTPADIIDTFWNEYKSFQQCTHPFVEPSRWATVNVTHHTRKFVFMA